MAAFWHGRNSKFPVTASLSVSRISDEGEIKVKSYSMENTASAPSSEEPKSLGATLVSRIMAAFSNVNIQRRPRSLKLCETLSLGEKRLLVLVECENQRFLVAATAQNISLLQTLSAPKDADEKSEL